MHGDLILVTGEKDDRGTGVTTYSELLLVAGFIARGSWVPVPNGYIVMIDDSTRRGPQGIMTLHSDVGE
jgi:hypothetical protein